MTNLQNLTSLVFYATTIVYCITLVLTCFIYKDYKRGFMDSSKHKFASKFEAGIYYVLSISYGACLLTLGLLIYWLYTALFAQGVIS